MFSILKIASWLLSPIGRFVGIGVIILAVVGYIYGKGRHDAKVSIKETIQRESTKAVDKADAARRAAAQRFDAGRVRDDGFLRDK